MPSPELAHKYHLPSRQEISAYAKTPLVFARLRQFNELVHKRGINFAANEFLSRMGISVEYPNGTPDCLSQEGVPVLTAGNHEQLLEGHIFLASSNRNDMRAIAGKEMGNIIGKHFAKYLLFVKGRLSASDRKGKRRKEPRWPYGRMTLKEIEELNNNSYKTAAEKLKEGFLVGIFPTGARQKITGRWLDGIGNIIVMIPQEERAKVLFLPFYCSGLDQGIINMLRQVPVRKPKETKVVKQYYAEPVLLIDITGDSNDPKEITQKIREYYLNLKEFKELLEPHPAS